MLLSTLRASPSIDPKKIIDIRQHRAHVGPKVHPNLELKDLRVEHTRRVTKRSGKAPIERGSLGPIVGKDCDPITLEGLYPRWATGDGWFTARVTTCGKFDRALPAAEQGDAGAYIEVVNDEYVAPPLAMKMHAHVATLDHS